MRLPLFDTATYGVGRSAAQFVKKNDDRSVCVADVLLRSFIRTASLQFCHWIAVRNLPFFIGPTFRAPTAAGNAVLERDIQSRAVNSSLASGNDFH